MDTPVYCHNCDAIRHFDRELISKAVDLSIELGDILDKMGCRSYGFLLRAIDDSSVCCGTPSYFFHTKKEMEDFIERG